MSDTDNTPDLYSSRNGENIGDFLVAAYFYCRLHDDVSAAIWLPKGVDVYNLDYEIFKCPGAKTCDTCLVDCRVYKYQGEYHPLKMVYDGIQKDIFDRYGGGYKYTYLPKTREIKQYIHHHYLGRVNSMAKKFPLAYKWDMDTLEKFTCDGENIVRTIHNDLYHDD